MNTPASSSVKSVRLPVAITSAGFALVQLDVTIVNVALPRMGVELGARVASLQWVVDAYTLAFAALLLGAGALSDRLGARPAYVAGFAVFALASAMCALASDAAELIAARALQGVGAALLVPSSLGLLARTCGDDRVLRARAVGWWTAAGGVSIAAGPIVGAVLLDAFGWPSIFLVNVPLCCIGALLAWWRFAATPANADARRFDIAGQMLAIGALTALIASIIEIARPRVAAAALAAGFAVALVASIAFVVVEKRVQSPMLPPRFFRRPDFTAAVLFGVAVNLTYYGTVFVLTLYLQQVLGYSPWQAGLAYLPLTATFIVSNIASGAAVARYGPRLPMVAGALLAAAGYALLARLDAASPYVAMAPSFACIPLGMGLAVPAMTTLALSGVEARFAATAAGTLNAARQVGGALGVALFGALVGSEHDRIISGLHAGALASVAFLAVAAAVAWTCVRGAPAGDGGTTMQPRAVLPRRESGATT